MISSDLKSTLVTWARKMPEMLPAIFFGHGKPMNAVLNNRYTEGWGLSQIGCGRDLWPP